MVRLGAVILLVAVLPAYGVVVRGHVTTPLGAPVAGVRVQLILGMRSVADAVSGVDGGYEIRSDLGGRFVLLTSGLLGARGTAVQIGAPFYGDAADLLTMDIALDRAAITPQQTAEETLQSIPLKQAMVAVMQVRPDVLLTHAMLVPELRPLPGVSVTQFGPVGAPVYLFLRGAGPEAITESVDGVSGENFGGGFNFSAASSSGLSALRSVPAVELSPVGNPLHLIGSEAGHVGMCTPAAEALRPSLTYTGDAGDLHALHNEAVGTATYGRVDALASFARFDTSNETPSAPFHIATVATNLGYQVSGGTSLRFTVRDDVSAGPLPVPTLLLNLPGKLADQNLYSGFSLDTRTAKEWHNSLRMGVVRKREEQSMFGPLPVGVPVTVTGANGVIGTGTVSVAAVPGREDRVTNRDEIAWQTDAPLGKGLRGVLTARYQDERAADLTLAARDMLRRRHVSVAAGFAGEYRHRLFYEAAGLVDHSETGSLRGAPRVGVGWAAVRPGTKAFRGTVLHATAATGFRDAPLREHIYGVTVAPRSRTVDISVDQNLFGEKLTLRTSYFHNQFAHETERVTQILPLRLAPTLAYRTQGVETEVKFQPWPRVFLHGGYTYLASLVEQGNGVDESVGGRMFHRPPQSGFFAGEVTGPSATFSLKGSAVSKSDDTVASYFVVPSTGLMLAHRNLSAGWLSLDANFTYALTHRITVFAQMTNLLNDRRMVPIGFVSSPFAIRSGLRVRLGGE